MTDEQGSDQIPTETQQPGPEDGPDVDVEDTDETDDDEAENGGEG